MLSLSILTLLAFFFGVLVGVILLLSYLNYVGKDAS